MIKRRKVIFTGQSGIDKASIIAELCDLAKNQNRTVRSFRVGEFMYQKTGARPGKILNQPIENLERVRGEVFGSIGHAADQNQDTDIFVDTHATFRWKHGLFKGFTVQEIADLEPDVCITFVSDVDHVKLRLRQSDFPLQLSLRDIMVWREEEILASELLASLTAQCSHYVVPRRINTTTLYRLIYENDIPKVYLSYPISSKQPKSVQETIEEFRQQFNSLDRLVVFDPMQVTEEPRLIRALRKTLKADQNADKVTVETLGRKLTLDVHELQEIRSYIAGQTRAFDYRMIEQSDAIIALIPEYQGAPFRADGIIFEVAYAGYKGKDAYLVWPASEEPSLMFDLEQRFSSVDQAASYFAQ